MNDCGEESTTRTKIELNSILSFDGDGKLETKTYQDLAHELFHLVQQAYLLFRNNCDAGRWIIEGTAEFVGIETARRLYPRRKPYTPCQIGMRSYKSQLYTNDQNQPADEPCQQLNLDYQAQSFWQFLGEYSTRRKFIATEEFVEPT